MTSLGLNHALLRCGVPLPQAICAAVALLATNPVHGTLSEFTDYTQWQTAAGSYTTIRFDEIPTFSLVTTQYQPIGVTFVGDLYQTVCCSSLVYPQDGTGLDGNGWVTLVFSQPMMSIAAHHPGTLLFDLYLEDQLIASSGMLGGGGANFFSGVISDQPFDRVRLYRLEGFGDQVFLDNLYFGPPIPAPAAASLLMLAAIGPRRRRRT